MEQLSEYHTKSRKILLAKLITLGRDEPSATITFDVDTLRPHDYGKKRVGRPRLNWLECTLADAWKELNGGALNPGLFQAGESTHVNRLKIWAKKFDEKHKWSEREQEPEAYDNEAHASPTDFGPFGEEAPVTPEMVPDRT